MDLHDDDAAKSPVPIAIVGYSFEFPQGMTSPDSFWTTLSEGKCASTDFPEDRMHIKSFYHPDRTRLGSISARGGCFVTEPLDVFDAPFFSITPAEAACTDPQHRRMLETTYHALEDAGITLEACSGSDTSVYTGSFTDDYRSVVQQNYGSDAQHAAIGLSMSMLANRISWFFNLKGASINLDSACSSSLSALHFACQDLWANRASMSLVGGANYVYHPDVLRFLSNLNFLSPDGRCWSFDERANGYARGEGCAVLVLKRLPDALRDGDNIKGVIRATGLNQDGRTPGITVPNEDAQVELITDTYRKANISMEPTRYFESHGTGTAVGDPKEANAIGRSFGRFRNSDDPLYIGAVKANIGHLEGCSGLAGVVKTLLVLEKAVIPPIAGLAVLNKAITPETYHLHFPRTEVPWPTKGLRRACVNSFGFGGTNATVIMDNSAYHLQSHQARRNGDSFGSRSEAQRCSISPAIRLNGMATYEDEPAHSKQLPPDVVSGNDTLLSQICHGDDQLLPRRLAAWSAFDQEGAQRLTTLYTEALSATSGINEDSLYTLSERRSLFSWRSFTILDRDGQTLRSSFSPPTPKKSGGDRRMAFVFTGQGAQYQGMGRRLLGFAPFRDSLSSSQGVLNDLDCPWSIVGFILGSEPTSLIDEAAYAQPLTTCLQIALVDLLSSFGVMPSTVLGHSSGEIAAAYAAGALSQAAAIKIAYHRGRVSSLIAEQNADLGMMAVALGRDDITEYIRHLRKVCTEVEITIACINSPKSVTLSGRTGQLDVLKTWLDDEKVFARRLRVPVAYHSPFMHSAAECYTVAMGALDLGSAESEIPLISSVTGDVIPGGRLRDPQYWVENMVSPVQFDAAFSRLLDLADSSRHSGEHGCKSFQVTDVIEIGPHSALQGPIRDILNVVTNRGNLVYRPSLLRTEDADTAVLKLVGTLWCSGVSISFTDVNQIKRRPGPTSEMYLPKYPFNHGRSYWKESRLSKHIRFPRFARNDLLGVEIPDSNPHMPQWYNTIRPDQLPWINDHRIQGERVLPGSAMLVMAIEAFKQAFADDMPIQGYQMHDITFKHPIKFSRDVTGVETRLHLSLPPPRADRILAWTRFKVFYVDGVGKFIECCSGSIRGHRSQGVQESTPPQPLFKGEESLSDWITTIAKASVARVDVQRIYNAASAEGIQYGPLFQVLDQVRVGKGIRALARINSRQRQEGLTGYATDFAPVHPVTLDGTMQMLLLALSQGRQDLPTIMPSRISSLWLDARHQGDLEHDHMVAMARGWTKGHRRAGADIVVTHPNSREPLIWLQDIEGTFIKGSNSTLGQGHKPSPDLCMRMSWRPDISTMTKQQLHDECIRERPDADFDEQTSYWSSTLAAYTFMVEALNFVETHPSIGCPEHLQPYVSWMKYQKERLQSGDLPFDKSEVDQLLSSETRREDLVKQVFNHGSQGKLAMTIARKLIPMLCAEVDPLEVLFSEGLVDEHYEAMLGNPYHSHPAKAFLELFSFKNPSINILEVGAGTGGTTLSCLQQLSSGEVNKFLRYDFTDISAGFFTRARAKFARYEHLMNFKVLDIEKDPIEQGFEAGKYDLVICSHVLHATTSLGESLRNVRKLLRTGGKLLLFETTKPECFLIVFIFGLLKGWWSPLQREHRSKFSPCVDTLTWDRLLHHAGFSGVDLEFLGQQHPECQYSSIIVATAVDGGPNGERRDGEVTIVANPNSAPQQKLVELLERRIPCSRTFSLTELAQREQDSFPGTILFLVEVELFLLFDMTETEFLSLQSILTRLKNIIWVTRSHSSLRDPRHCVVDGLARSRLSEDATLRFVTLTLDQQCRSATDDASHILHTLHQLNSSVEELENNMVVSNGVRHIVRVAENHEMDNVIAQKMLPYRYGQFSPGEDTSLTLQQDTPGSLDTLGYYSRVKAASPLGDDELTIEVKAFGLDSRDYLSACGRLNDAHLGSECAGIVSHAGRSVSFRIGDRVAAIGNSLCCTSIKTDSTAVVGIPDDISFVEACSTHNAIWIAYHSLINIGRASRHDTVLLYDATTSVGHILVQAVKEIGAKLLVTAKSPAGALHLKDTHGLSMSSILDCADHDLPGEVRLRTGGTGVDIFVGALNRDATTEYAQCLAPFGRLIDTRVKEYSIDLAAFAASARHHCLFTDVNLAEQLRANAASAHRIFQDAMRWASGRGIRAPANVQVFGIGDTEAAFRSFEKGDAVDQVVVELVSEKKIEALIPNTPIYHFSKDATYLIAGGLGGLGRSFASWMVDRGARNLVLLSRSGVRTQAARELLSELHDKGCKVVTPLCDVTDLGSLVRVVKDVTTTMPPIRGCIQATVALRDATFQNMTYDDWKTGLDSKAAGSWNLHHMLPEDLDFFVIIASLNGIVGGRGQANYAAGNAFKDALAHHRISLGQKAVSIDLGLMPDEGIVSENQAMLSGLRRLGYLRDVYHDELIALLDHFCNPNLPLLAHEDAQVLVGLEPTRAILAKGIDINPSLRRPLTRHLFHMGGHDTSRIQHTNVDRATALRAAGTDEDAEALAGEWFTAQIAHVLGLPVTEVDNSKQMNTYGIDSLLVIDLKNWLAKELGTEIPVFQLLGDLSIAEISALAAATSSFRRPRECTESHSSNATFSNG